MTEPETQLTLQEQLESLILVHRQANWDKNLGQYRSEHKCECGYTFVSNGHIEDSSVRVLMAEHISVQLTDLFTQALTSLKTEMEKKKLPLSKDESSNDWFYGYGNNMGISECQRVIDGMMK